MPKPANVMTSAPSGPRDNYDDLEHDDLVTLAEERGLDLKERFGHAYVRNELIIDALRERDRSDVMANPGVDVAPGEDLEATEKFVGKDQPAHRHDANLASHKRRGDYAYLTRADLVRLARGEVLDLDGLKVAADPADFPQEHRLR